MHHHTRVEITQPLSAGLRDELSRRFGPVQIRQEPDRTVLAGLAVDQAGLRALLGLLWDAGVHITAMASPGPSQGAPHVRD